MTRIILFSIGLFVFQTLSAQDDSSYVVLDGDTVLYEHIEVETEYTQIDSMVETAREYLGVKYKVGGCSSSGFDCSGFLYYCAQQLSIDIPRASYVQAAAGDYIEADSLQAGDFIFFNGRNIASGAVGHVAMVTEVIDGAIKIIHATSSRGVMEEVLQQNSYFMQRWIYNKRLLEE
ncbi:MAG: C40 family peptidase [Chitinophagales bacterium]